MVTFLTALSGVDEAFTRWFRLGRSRQDALKHPLEPDHTALAKLIQRGRDRVFDDLGYRISGWNGAEDEDAVGFDVHCGSFAEGIKNACVFTLPSQGDGMERVLNAEILSGLLRAAAIAWEPDWSVAISHAHRSMLEPRRVKGTPLVGWITYLARHLGTVPPLPVPVRIEPVGEKGTLIVLTSERFTVNNPEQVALADRVRESLDRAGLLKPIQPQG